VGTKSKQPTQDNCLQDKSNDHSYFSMTPNMLDDLLDPYQYRLYGHIKRVCGESGKCWQSTRTMAKKCKMSVGKVSESKKRLKEMGLIAIEECKRPNGGLPYHSITIVDIWQRNIEWCATRASSPDEQASSQGERPSSPDERPSSQGEPKKTPLKKTPEEEKDEKLFFGEDGKPKREPFEVSLPETDDPTVLGAHCAGVQAKEGTWTVTAEAGGDDPWADKPLKTFCVLAGRNTLKDNETTEWSRQLREWAVEWGATPEETCQALQAIPDSESDWKTFSWPGGAEFKRTMDTMIDRIRSGLPINAKGNGNGRHDKPEQPTVVVFPEPEYLMVDGV
jgi:hypothetical protein